MIINRIHQVTLLQCIRDAPEEKVDWLGTVFLAPTVSQERRNRILDTLTEYGSPAAQRVIIRMIFRAEAPLIGDLTHALTGLVTIKWTPLPELIDVIEEIVFNPRLLSMRAQSQHVREQAMLTLGAFTRSMLPRDPERAQNIIGKLVAWLYDSGPDYDNRARRSTVEVESDHRLPVLYALGNSLHPNAVSHIIKHAKGEHAVDMFTTESHRIRHTATYALGDFASYDSDAALLHVAHFDPIMVIRRLGMMQCIYLIV